MSLPLARPGQPRHTAALILLFSLVLPLAPSSAQALPGDPVPMALPSSASLASGAAPVREENLFGVALESIMAADGRAFALCRDQDEFARLCRERCPREAETLDLAQAGFAATLGPALTGLDQEYGPGTLDRLYEAVRAQGNRTQGSDLCTRCKALSRRYESPMDGGFPPLVLETLLARHPKYAGHPDQEMADGFKRVWRTPAKTPTAQGLSLTFEHPITWAEQKNMPIALVALAANNGAGPGWMMLRVSSLPPGADKLPPERALDQGVAAEIRLFAGYTPLSSRKGELAGLPARVLVGEWTVKVNNRAALVRMRSIWAMKGQALIGLHLAAGAGKDGNFPARAAEAFTRLEPLFDRMAASLKVEP